MKASEAPEKIWLVKYTQNLMLSDPNSNTYVEYTHTDAFIKKACEWIKYNNENGGCLFDGWIEDFKKYIRGE